jgi:hypothetical protein
MSITTVVIGNDNSYVVTCVDDVSMSIATILFFKCVRAPKL